MFRGFFCCYFCFVVVDWRDYTTTWMTLYHLYQSLHFRSSTLDTTHISTCHAVLPPLAVATVGCCHVQTSVHNNRVATASRTWVRVTQEKPTYQTAEPSEYHHPAYNTADTSFTSLNSNYKTPCELAWLHHRQTSLTMPRFPQMRNRTVTTAMHWNIESSGINIFYKWTYSTPVIMRGPILRQL